MGMFSYKDMPASLVPFGKPTFDLIRNEDRVAIFDFKSDLVVILDHTTPANGFIGTVQQAIDAGVISFTRATSAGRVNAAGLYESVASGVWRRQYDPVTLQPLGYLPEPQRTNLVISSNDFSTGWAFTNVTQTPGQAGGPDGLNSLTRLTETAATGFHFAYIAFSHAAGAVAGRFFVSKASTETDLSLSLWNGTDASYARVNFNPITGAISSSAGTLAKVVATPTGWQVLVAGTATTTTTAARVMLGGGNSYAGDGTTFADVGFVQAEVGSYPTSYIPTAGSAVTRNADQMVVSLSKLPFSTSAGTLIEHLEQELPTANAHTGVHIDNGAGGNRIFSTSVTAGQGQRAYQIWGGGGNTLAHAAPGGLANNGPYKQAIAWAENDAEVVINGAPQGGADNSITLPSGLITMRFGFSVTGSDATYYAQPMRSAILIPRRLSQAEMIARTAP